MVNGAGEGKKEGGKGDAWRGLLGWGWYICTLFRTDQHGLGLIHGTCMVHTQVFGDIAFS